MNLRVPPQQEHNQQGPDQSGIRPNVVPRGYPYGAPSNSAPARNPFGPSGPPRVGANPFAGSNPPRPGASPFSGPAPRPGGSPFSGPAPRPQPGRSYPSPTPPPAAPVGGARPPVPGPSLRPGAVPAGPPPRPAAGPLHSQAPRPSGPNIVPPNSPAPRPAPPPGPNAYATQGGVAAPATPAERAIAQIFTPEQLDLFDRERFSELHFDINNSLRRFPDNTDALVGLGICAMAVGEPERAATHFLKALKVDDTIRLGEVVTEVPTSDPEDWLMMAEELGHSGYPEVAIDICMRIVTSGQFSTEVRQLAAKTKETVEQDYNEARARIATGNAPKDQGDGAAFYRIGSWFALVFLPLLVAGIFGCLSYSSYQFNEGMGLLRLGIYRVELVKKGNLTQEQRGPTEPILYAAASKFQKAFTFNPFAWDCFYYEEKTYAVLLNLGRIRIGGKKPIGVPWKPAQFKTVKENRQQAADKLKERQVDPEKIAAEDEKWKSFYKDAVNNPGTVIF